MKNVIIFCLIIIFGCNGPEDVDPKSRSTFFKVIGTSLNSTGYKTIEVFDGYVTVSTAISDTTEYSYLTKTDKDGNVLWNQIYPDTNGLDVIALNDGYIVVGDSINSQGVGDNATKILLFQVDGNGNVVNSTTLGDPSATPRDYHGVSLAKNSTDEIVVLGTRENEFDQDEMIVAGFNNSLIEQWQEVFTLNNENYRVGSNIHYDQLGQIIWVASSITYNAEDNSIIDKSSISVPVTLSNSENINNDTYGDNIAGTYIANDIMPVAGGYGIVGRTDVGGSNDIFYLKTNTLGFIDENSFKLISTSISGISFNGSDAGTSLIGTSNGTTVIMGTISTTTQIGNGGTDIYLLNVDYNGNVLWESIIGGSGNESGQSIIETSDGGFLITGTNDFQGSAVTVLIKTNKQGRLIE